MMMSLMMWLEYALLLAHSRANRLLDNPPMRLLVAASFGVAMSLVVVATYAGAIINLGRRGISPARLASVITES